MELRDIPVLSGATPFGHLRELNRDRLTFFRRFNRECGDIGRIKALSRSLVVANSPELLHEMLVEKAKSFTKSPGIRGPLKPLAGEGLFTSEGDLWRRQRKLMAPLFTQGEIGRYAEVMAECADHAARGLSEGEVFDAARLTTHVAMRVAGKALFDTDTLDEADELGSALTVALRWVNERSGAIPYILQLFAAGTLYDLAAKSWRM
jgi:cytochrome P450